MTDASGNVSGCAGGALCQRLAYDEYGNLSTSASGTGEPFQYTGRRFDVETGLYYYRANAAEAKAATSYVGRQLELKITSAVLGTIGLVVKSPTLMKLSLVAAAAALRDQKVTTGHVDPREVAVTAISAFPGVEGVATAVSGMKEVGEVAQVGQEFIHTGAATAGAALAVGEAMPNHGSNSAPQQPSSEQMHENTTPPVKAGCTPGASC